MISPLAPRILALPADVRRTLAGVEGPGWYIAQRVGATTLWDNAPYAHPQPLGQRGFPCVEAWWPANPAASVAAVMRCSIWYAHRLIADNGAMGGDTPAALSIIEAHVAKRSTHG